MQLPLPSGAPEKEWRNALAAKLNGKIEQVIEGGRIDVETASEVFELDRPTKWHEGLGQALHYSDVTGKRGVLALISYSQGSKKLREKSQQRYALVESECRRHNIRLLVLFPAKSEDMPHTQREGHD